MKRTLYSADWQWIDIQSPTADELQEVAAQYGLHPSSVIDLLQPEHLPKYEEIGEVVFIIGRVFDSKSQLEADTIQELTNKVALFFSQNYIITIHQYPIPVIEEVEQRFISTDLVKTPLELLGKLTKGIFETYLTPAHKLAEELDFYEAKTFLTNRLPQLTKSLYHLKRKAAVSRRVLHLSETILDNLGHKGLPPTELQDIRDLYVHVETLYGELNDSTNNLINIYLSLSSQKTNEVMRVLTIFSAFFLPLTFIAGIYGMNFEFMPELEKKNGYPFVLAGMAIVTLGIYLWFRKKGWL